MIAQPRRRRRPAVACIPCRKRKIRCNRGMPCSNCTRARHATCAYETLSPPPSPRRRTIDLAPNPQSSLKYPSPASTADGGTRAASVTDPATATPHDINRPAAASVPSLSEYEAMKNRIRQLEERLSLSNPKTIREAPPFTIGNEITGAIHVHRQGQAAGRDISSQSITHKGRVFGRSHWLNSFIPIRDMFEVMEKTTALSIIERCKYLARVVKNQRAPAWPTPPTTDLPDRDVCDGLIDSYLETTESLYRVLHIPSFKRDYEAIWQPNPTPTRDFLIQLKLVLAIGASAHDDAYSHRTSAVRWIYEAQTHLSEPEFKPRLTVPSLQNHILLLFARQTANIGGSLVWTSAGELLRTAMFMGLHKDPERLGGPGALSRLGREMHRRLWNTVLEVALLTSMDSGGPPLVSMGDFDTLPPGNIPDEKLLDEGAASGSEGRYTETSIARAFRDTFPVRLAIVRYLNDLGSKGTYDEALQLDKDLRNSQRTFSRALESLRNQAGLAWADTGARLANFILISYTSALHTPFLTTAFRDPTYAFSRISLLQNALTLWPLVRPTSALAAHPSPAPDTWRRMTICNHRAFNTGVKQVCVAIAVELRAQVQDEGGAVGAGPFRGDLLDVLKEVVAWNFETVGIGETNIKGYISSSLVAVYVEGVQRRLGREELSGRLVETAGRAAEECLPLLEGMLEQGQVKEGRHEVQGTFPAPSGGLDWGDIFPFCQMSDMQYGAGAWDPLGWILDEESRGEPMAW